MDKNLYELIEEIQEKMNNRDLSDDYLSECGCTTRDEIGICEYFYGITMIPCEWILPYLKELKKLREKVCDEE